jgi:hypothetical protein
MSTVEELRSEVQFDSFLTVLAYRKAVLVASCTETGKTRRELSFHKISLQQRSLRKRVLKILFV